MIEVEIAVEIIQMAFNRFLADYRVWLFGWFALLSLAHLAGYIGRRWANR